MLMATEAVMGDNSHWLRGMRLEALDRRVIYLGFGSLLKERLLYTLNKLCATQVKSYQLLLLE